MKVEGGFRSLSLLSLPPIKMTSLHVTLYRYKKMIIILKNHATSVINCIIWSTLIRKLLLPLTLPQLVLILFYETFLATAGCLSLSGPSTSNPFCDLPYLRWSREKIWNFYLWSSFGWEEILSISLGKN